MHFKTTARESTAIVKLAKTYLAEVAPDYEFTSYEYVPNHRGGYVKPDCEWALSCLNDELDDGSSVAESVRDMPRSVSDHFTFVNLATVNKRTRERMGKHTRALSRSNTELGLPSELDEEYPLKVLTQDEQVNRFAIVKMSKAIAEDEEYDGFLIGHWEMDDDRVSVHLECVLAKQGSGKLLMDTLMYARCPELQELLFNHSVVFDLWSLETPVSFYRKLGFQEFSPPDPSELVTTVLTYMKTLPKRF